MGASVIIDVLRSITVQMKGWMHEKERSRCVPKRHLEARCAADGGAYKPGASRTFSSARLSMTTLKESELTSPLASLSYILLSCSL